MLKTDKQEMYYLHYHNALWGCFGFHIAQIDKMLLNQAMLPDWAIGPDWSNESLCNGYSLVCVYPYQPTLDSAFFYFGTKNC